MGILDIFFPRRCLSCGSFGGYVCSECVNKLSVLKFQKCPMCEKRSVTGLTHARCKTVYGMDGLVGVFDYKGLMKKMIGKYKFSFAYDLVGDLTEAMISFSDLEMIAHKKFDLVTGIPLHKSRQKERGFNQADLIGKRAAEYLDLKFDDKVVERLKKTKIQSGLPRKERLKNIRGAFGVKGNMKNKKILLVDDVWTTGSTMRECTKVLKRNGATEVWGLVLAM